MPKALSIAGAVIIALILFLAIWKRNHSIQQSSTEGKETYLGLRNLVLGGSRAKYSLPATSYPIEPWGVVIDWGIPAGTATAVPLLDGTASIYLSSGGGSIGGIGQEPIRNAAKKAVSLAAEVQSQMSKTETFPLPETGQVRFYILTDAGTYTRTALEAEPRTGQSSFSKLGNAMQAIVTEYRILQEKR